MNRFARTLAAFVTLALALAGCTVVKVHGSAKDEVEIKHHFGVMSLLVSPRAGAVVIDSVTFGAINAADGFSLGYRAATMAAVARDSCRLIVWVSDEGQLKQLSELLQDRADVCVVPAGHSKRETP